MNLITEIDRIERELANQAAELQTAGEGLEAARREVDALSCDDGGLSAVELVARRREAADRLAVAEIEHRRAADAETRRIEALETKLLALGRGLEAQVVAEADRRAKLVREAVNEILGAAARLPELIEHRAPWVACLRGGLNLRLRTGERGTSNQIALLRHAAAALDMPAPPLLATFSKSTNE